MFWKRLAAIAAAFLIATAPLPVHADYFGGATISGSYSDNVTLTTSNSDFYRADNIGPGDETGSDITLTNNGQKNVKIRFVDVENMNAGENDLSPYLILTVTDDTGKIIFNDSMDKIAEVSAPIIDFQEYKPGESHVLHVSINDPITNTNETIGKEMATRWNFEAVAGEDNSDDNDGNKNDQDNKHDQNDDSTDGKKTGDVPYDYLVYPLLGAGAVLAVVVVTEKKKEQKNA